MYPTVRRWPAASWPPITLCSATSPTYIFYYLFIFTFISANGSGPSVITHSVGGGIKLAKQKSVQPDWGNREIWSGLGIQTGWDEGGFCLGLWFLFLLSWFLLKEGDLLVVEVWGVTRAWSFANPIAFWYIRGAALNSLLFFSAASLLFYCGHILVLSGFLVLVVSWFPLSLYSQHHWSQEVIIFCIEARWVHKGMGAGIFRTSGSRELGYDLTPSPSFVSNLMYIKGKVASLGI